jgi:extracellular factor (EF) 3-hydroxypalmitic acid methyl ester biosynthesis protein
MLHSVQEMNKPLKGDGNGNGHGVQNVIRELAKKAAKIQAVASPSAFKENQVTFLTAEGVELHGALTRLTRNAVFFELYNPDAAPRFSETLEEFKIILQEQTVYSGRATVRNVLDAGTKIVCETTLRESDWTDLDPGTVLQRDGELAKEFKSFLNNWQKLYKVSPEFKVAVADLQTFLHDLRLWLEQVELSVQAQPKSKQDEAERKILQVLLEPLLPTLASLFEKFERLISKIENDPGLSHSLYAKRLLHPLVLSAPFMRRTFEKPLGYAGDYEMVNMMTCDPFQGGSIFAKILNTFFLNTPPVIAHRNRIDSLTQQLRFEVSRTAMKGRTAKVFNLGCGPALEIQRFLVKSLLSDNAAFTLLDFNDETVAYTGRILNQIKEKYNCRSTISIVKKSVAQLLKNNSQFTRDSYDFVYCAGLFDYLPDTTCRQLVDLFYELAAPGGLVLVTNVHVNNPSRGWMECMVDWHLVYRDAEQMSAILPRHVPKKQTRIFVEPIGVNIFAEIRKPENA